MAGLLHFDLPKHLHERIRVVTDQINPDGELVLYWMRTAIRAVENPALDVAVAAADQLNLPLLVYHSLSQHYQYASDRHHTFILQGAADVQQQFSQLNCSYAFHLATQDDQQKHLITLADRAALVVTEEMPVDPSRHFLNVLREKTDTAIACVDTACIVPMRLTEHAYTRAFQFRDATNELYAERLERAWPNLNLTSRPYDLSRLPFRPIDFENEQIHNLVAQCELDHTVSPVVDSIGGSRVGYGRWNRFKRLGLRSYASKRNNAMVDGVSRMSPYLHYGMVSPMRIARETAAAGGPGSKKFLDELLSWRELAYHFCFHRADHDQWSAIPSWAQATLRNHETDSHPKIYSWEQLARAQTDDDLWNAAQKSLLMQGELHNNVRMTWGKAILNWTSDPESALRMMIDLNHRYALDGRDPASYGGLLWCLGQFDRPFKPEQQILGTVRPRPTHHHAKRLDPTAYMEKVTAPRFEPIPHVAVIGAGMSGLMAARTLSDHGVRVSVFEKSRNAGGRMATRRRDGQPVFDHGAQYFTARDERFARYVKSWEQEGVVAKWPDDSQSVVVMNNGKLQRKQGSVERYVGIPGMRSVAEHLAGDLKVNFRTTILKIKHEDQQYCLIDAEDNVHGPFDHLIIATPSAQASDLMKTIPIDSDCQSLIEAIDRVKMNACWATMIQLNSPLVSKIAWAGAFVHDSFLSWAARDGSKPCRDAQGETLVLHASPEWSEKNLEREHEWIASEMLAEFWRVSGSKNQSAKHLQAHRWRYAIPTDPASSRTLFNRDLTIGCCGDWVGGPKVEGAFLSGAAAAGRILGNLKAPASQDLLREQKLLFE